MYIGSVAPARVKVCGNQAAQSLQELAAERCSMPYRAPELFNVESYCMVDERTDIWVYILLLIFFIENHKIVTNWAIFFFSLWDVFCMPCVIINPHLMQFMKEGTVLL